MSLSNDGRKTWRDALQEGADILSAIEDRETARLEAEVLLRHAIGVSRSKLYAHLDSFLASEQKREYMGLVERRLRREPVAYIVENREFFGLDFYVNRQVLIPRPETEILVERALNWVRAHRAPAGGWRIVDVGTGSGAIAVSLAIHLPEAEIVAIDISEEALRVAGVNCERHGVSSRVQLRQGDLLTGVAEKFDIVVANLPYVTREEMVSLSRDIREYEPTTALAGGEDGLDLFRRLFAQAPQALKSSGLLLAEIGAGQGQRALDIARQAFRSARVELVKDYAGLDRVIEVEQI